MLPIAKPGPPMQRSQKSPPTPNAFVDGWGEMKEK